MILDEFGNPVKFGYAGAKPHWRRTHDAIQDRSRIVETEEKVLNHGSRLELLSNLRDLERNNPICRAIVQVFVSNLGNCTFNASTENKELDEVREKAFGRYFKNCEITGQGMQRVLACIISDLLLAGEVFIVLTKGGSIQLLPSERIGSGMYSDDKRENEIEGLVLNKFGMPIAYRVAGLKDGVVDYTQGSYIPARDVIHIAHRTRIGQLRGTPMLAPALKTLEDIHEVQSAFTAKVKTSSALTGFITSNAPTSARWDGSEFSDEPLRSTYKKLYSGSLLLLEQGESVQTIQGGAIDGVDKFLVSLISFACSSVGITMENLVGWSNASFSSSKATRAVTNHRFGQIRDDMENQFLRRLCRWRQFKWENNEELPAMDESTREEFSFQWTGSPTLDRRQDAQTDALLLEKGLASPSTIFANNGLDYQTEVEKIGRDKKLMNEKTNPSVEVDPVADAMGSMSPLVATKILENMTQEEIRALVNLPPKVEEEAQPEPEEVVEEDTEDLSLAETYNDYPKSASNNAKRALRYKEENNPKCGTPVGWARANQLAKGEKISRDTIARMASFKRHQQHKGVPYDKGCGGLMWDAWGGTSGINWAIRKLKAIDKK
jgi:capsid protein